MTEQIYRGFHIFMATPDSHSFVARPVSTSRELHDISGTSTLRGVVSEIKEDALRFPQDAAHGVVGVLLHWGEVEEVNWGNRQGFDSSHATLEAIFRPAPNQTFYGSAIDIDKLGKALGVPVLDLPPEAYEELEEEEEIEE